MKKRWRGRSALRAALCARGSTSLRRREKGEDAQGDGPRIFVVEVVVVEVRADESAKTDDVRLQASCCTNPAVESAEHDGKNDPADASGRAEGLLKDQTIMPAAAQCSPRRKRQMALVRDPSRLRAISRQ